MGFLSDDEIQFEGSQSDVDSPPGSPRLAATHARAIAENFVADFSEPDSRAARNYASLCCEEFGLTDMDKDDVLRTSQMHAHLITIRQYTRVVALTHNINRLLTDSFLESTEFKDHVTRRVQATFLDADLPTYVRGSTARLVQHMQENPASWRIPPVVHAHFINSKVFRKAIAAIASNFRGDMRRKIKKSILDKSDIGAFTRKLCVKGYQPDMSHWRRFALLRCYMVDWEKLPVRPGKGHGMSFWAFIDTKLDKLRAHCARPSEDETQKAIKELLKSNLTDDRKLYKGPASGATKLPARIHVPEWQRDHARAVQDMMEYVVEANTEEDMDDDEGSEPIEPDGHQVAPGTNTRTEEDGGHEGDAEDNTIEAQRHARLEMPAGSTNPEGRTRGARTGAVLVPETQETLRNGTPAPSTLRSEPETQSVEASFVPETPLRAITSQIRDQQNAGPSGSTSGQATQAGWASGTLADRRPRTTHKGASPIGRANPSTSQSR